MKKASYGSLIVFLCLYFDISPTIARFFTVHVVQPYLNGNKRDSYFVKYKQPSYSRCVVSDLRSTPLPRKNTAYKCKELSECSGGEFPEGTCLKHFTSGEKK